VIHDANNNRDELFMRPSQRPSLNCAEPPRWHGTPAVKSLACFDLDTRPESISFAYIRERDSATPKLQSNCPPMNTKAASANAHSIRGGVAARQSDYRVFSSDEFLRAPAEAAALAAKGTPVCISAGKATIIVGSSGPRRKKRRSMLFRKLGSKLLDSFHSTKRPLDVSWIE
jgi:hypothetical protein